jgi:hypothetical protein
LEQGSLKLAWHVPALEQSSPKLVWHEKTIMNLDFLQVISGLDFSVNNLGCYFGLVAHFVFLHKT